MNAKRKQVILFDGYCNLCSGLVTFVIKRDIKEKFTLAPLQSESGRALLSRLGLAENEIETFVLVDCDEFYLRSTAALKVLRGIGGIWSAFYLYIFVPAPIRDFIYNLIANSRYRIFGKKDQCFIPADKTRDRFLQ